MNRFLKYWRLTGRGEAFRAHAIAYADDFVILSRGCAAEALAWTKAVMTRLGLTLRRSARMSELPPASLPLVLPLVRTLVSERLLCVHPARDVDPNQGVRRTYDVRSGDRGEVKRAALLREEPFIESPHEMVFKAWPQLHQWIAAEQDFLLGIKQIKVAQEIWANAGDQNSRARYSASAGTRTRNGRRVERSAKHQLGKQKQ
jgi:hypothetical protein